MKGLDPAAKKETLRIAVGTVVLSVVMELVFIVIRSWDLTVLWGNLLGAFAAVLNFFLMALTVVKCISLAPDKAAMKIRVSQGGRLMMLAVIAILAAVLPCFNLYAAVIPLLFPRIVIMFWQLTHRGEKLDPGAQAAVAACRPANEDTEDTEDTKDTEN